MQLNIAERMHLLPLLPEKGSFATLKILHQLRQELSFSEQELADGKIIEEDGRLAWPDADALVKDIEVGQRARSTIVDILENLSMANELTMAHVSLYEKFVEVTGEPEFTKVEPSEAAKATE